MNKKQWQSSKSFHSNHISFVSFMKLQNDFYEEDQYDIAEMLIIVLKKTFS